MNSNDIKEVQIIHISIGKVYQYKHLIFENHHYCGPQFLRHKDHEDKDMRHASGRDWGVFNQWWRMDAEKREQYRIGI